MFSLFGIPLTLVTIADLGKSPSLLMLLNSSGYLLEGIICLKKKNGWLNPEHISFSAVRGITTTANLEGYAAQ